MTEPQNNTAVEDLTARVKRLENSLAALDNVIRASAARAAETENIDAGPDVNEQSGGAEPSEELQEGKTGLDLRALDAWVRDWLLPTFRRDPRSLGQRWCSQWWRHAEAIVRLEAMRVALIDMTAEGGAGMATWLRDVADVQCARLFDDKGPFGDCRTEPAVKHSELPPLPALPIPAELLDEIDAGASASAVLRDPSLID